MGSRGLLASYLLYVSSGESTFVPFTSMPSCNAGYQHGAFCQNRAEINHDPKHL